MLSSAVWPWMAGGAHGSDSHCGHETATLLGVQCGSGQSANRGQLGPDPVAGAARDSQTHGWPEVKFLRSRSPVAPMGVTVALDAGRLRLRARSVAMDSLSPAGSSGRVSRPEPLVTASRVSDQKSSLAPGAYRLAGSCVRRC